MPTPTNRYINNGLVVVTPVVPSGSAITVKGVQGVNLGMNARTTRGAGDADLFDTFAAVTEIAPSLSIDTINPAQLNALAPGTVCTVAWTLNDARNGAVTGGGALIFTVINAVFTPGALNSRHRQFADNTHVFETYSSDGTTNPVSVAAA